MRDRKFRVLLKLKFVFTVYQNKKTRKKDVSFLAFLSNLFSLRIQGEVCAMFSEEIPETSRATKSVK